MQVQQPAIDATKPLANPESFIGYPVTFNGSYGNLVSLDMDLKLAEVRRQSTGRVVTVPIDSLTINLGELAEIYEMSL